MIKNLLDWIETERFRIRPTSSLSITDLDDGKMEYKNGILYVYDEGRAKWLSIQRQTLVFGRAGLTNNQYLNFAGGGISSNSGYRLPRHGCIVGVTVQTSTSSNYNIHIRKGDDTTGDSEANIQSLTVAGFGAGDIAVNKEIYSGEHLQCYLEYTGSGLGVNDPIVMIEVAWRE